MLRLILPEEELFDDSTQEFITKPKVELELEHSLLSLSKWESFFEKSFLGTTEKTDQETWYYIYCMLLDDSFEPSITKRFGNTQLKAVTDYIQSSQSATTFGEMPQRPGKGEIITAELIYYWMVAFTIPFECERWHLNRLFSLIKICNLKNGKPQKRSKAEVARSYQELNAKRKAQLGTSG